MEETIISVKNVTKTFGDLTANDRVSLDIRKGEIMALLGENGAGKSTLMKVIYGLYSRDSGDITIKGKSMPRKYSPAEALHLGVSMVPQHFMLVDSFTVAENIILGEEQKIQRFLVNKDKSCKHVEALCRDFGIDVSPSQRVENLPLGVKQKIEILKTLYRNTDVLILDEPTTVLTPQEVREFFDLLKGFQEKGMTIIFITHKLNEVMDIADRITVMRGGHKIATFNKSDTSIEELSCTMVGREVESVHVEENICSGENPYLRLIDVTTKHDGERCNLKNLSLDLCPGRITGVAGIDGNGQTELVEVLSGVKIISDGEIIIDDTKIKCNDLKTMRSLGIGVIPEDRTIQGLVLDLSIKDNILLGHIDDRRFSKQGIYRSKTINNFIDNLIKKYDIRPPRKSAICRYVSGGNQQKVVLARELERPNLNIVVASQPSRGLDVGAIQFTYQTLLKLREEGKTVLLISSDLDEIKALSDDIAVIRDGSIVMSCQSCDLTKDEIGLYMGDADKDRIKETA